MSFLTGCGVFHSVQNAKKQSIKNATVNSIEQTEVSVKYICNEGFVYSLDNPIVNCTENGFDAIGKCVKGFFQVLLCSLKLVKTIFIQYLWYNCTFLTCFKNQFNVTKLTTNNFVDWRKNIYSLFMILTIVNFFLKTFSLLSQIKSLKR